METYASTTIAKLAQTATGARVNSHQAAKLQPFRLVKDHRWINRTTAELRAAKLSITLWEIRLMRGLLLLLVENQLA